MQNRTYHHGALKLGLIEAASNLIKKRGHIGFNLRDLAKECNVSAPAIYRHFNSKNALMVAIAETGFENILNKFNLELPSEKEMSAKERIACLGEIYVNFAIENEGEFRVMFSRELCQIPEYESVAPLAEQSFSVLKELIFEILPNDISENERHNQVIKSWALVHGLANLRIDQNLNEYSVEQFNEIIKSVLAF